MEMVILRILVFLMVCAVIYMWINYHRHEKLLNDYEKNHNQVKFYVVRYKYNNVLYLYLGKPRRDTCKFYACNKGSIVANEYNFSHFGLNPEDFENLRFEDEPVEVFLKLEG